MRPNAFSLFSGIRRLPTLCALALVSVALAACSGDDSNGGSGNSSSNGPNMQPIAATAANTVPITVNAGVAQVRNIPNVSVTVCQPGTSNCQTIDNIQLDTASVGLRLASSAASQVLGSLPNATASDGNPLAECTQFAIGNTLGTVRTADIKMGGEQASSVPIQIIGDLTASNVLNVASDDCAGGSLQSTPQDLGANGILGVGTAQFDCGTGCLLPADSLYYSCTAGTSCSPTGLSTAKQVVNPVTRFAADNNGVIVQMPPVGDGGAASATGTLVFGIGTQSNNALTGATKYSSDANANVDATFLGSTQTAFFDTGSNGIFFEDSSLTQCPSGSSFFCPSSTQQRTATIRGTDGATSGNVTFNVANAQTLTRSGNYAFNNLAGNINFAGNVDFGLPFFYGRHIYFGYDLTGSTPYVAF
jgi:hypothetical protein